MQGFALLFDGEYKKIRSVIVASREATLIRLSVSDEGLAAQVLVGSITEPLRAFILFVGHIFCERAADTPRQPLPVGLSRSANRLFAV